MTRWTLSFLTLIFLLLGHQSKGQTNTIHFQDTLVFQQKKNKEKKFNLPLNEYYLILKPTSGKKKNVFITGYSDTTLTVKIYSFKKKEERKAKRKQLAEIYNDTSLTVSQIDSLTRLVMYSQQDTIKLSQIDKIKIPNRNRKEMKRIVAISDGMALGWLIGFIPLIAITQSIPVFIALEALAIPIIVFAIVIDNKTIHFNKWEISD